MVARARVTEEGTGQYEYFEVYRARLKEEAAALKNRLKGKLVHRSMTVEEVQGRLRLRTHTYLNPWLKEGTVGNIIKNMRKTRRQRRLLKYAKREARTAAEAGTTQKQGEGS